MKCDELEKEYFYTNSVITPSTRLLACYIASEVDEAIAELKQKLEDAKATAYADSVDAGMENRRLNRKLWLARANRVLDKIALFKLLNASISTMNPEDGARQEYEKWKKNLGKFLKKADEYK